MDHVTRLVGEIKQMIFIIHVEVVIVSHHVVNSLSLNLES